MAALADLRGWGARWVHRLPGSTRTRRTLDFFARRNLTALHEDPEPYWACEPLDLPQRRALGVRDRQRSLPLDRY